MKLIRCAAVSKVVSSGNHSRTPPEHRAKQRRLFLFKPNDFAYSKIRINRVIHGYLAAPMQLAFDFHWIKSL